MKAGILTILLSMSLLGCNNVTELSEQSPALSYDVSQNYQAVYASLVSAGRRCYGIGPGFAMSQSTLNTDLYPDLGYGEISYTVAGPLSSYTPEVTRIEKMGAGARVTIRAEAGQTASTGTLAAWQKYWIAGGKKCPAIGAMQPPA